MKNLLKTSLIISTYNRPNALALVLFSVLRQTELPDEVIIADDGSTSATTDLVRNFASVFPVPLRHVWQEDSGFRLAEIRNKAIAESSGNYIIMTDGDIVLEKHFVEDHQNFSENRKYIQGKRAALMQNGTLNALTNQNCGKFSWLMNDLKFRENAFRFKYLSFASILINKRNRTIGANESFWRDDLLAVNGYNEDFTGWGAEDSDLCLRLGNYGVARKSISFACTGFHLWHDYSQYPRDLEKLEMKREYINDLKNNKLMRCENGIDKYL